VKHVDDTVSGPTADYHIGISLGDPLDSYEPDNSFGQAVTIPTNGTPQPHNFTPANDQDWVKFVVDTDTLPYVIQTDNLIGDNDTVLHLVGTNGTTELTSNDDYGGERSRITYIFPSSGTYFARVHHFRTNRSGLGTKYDLSVIRTTSRNSHVNTDSAGPSRSHVNALGVRHPDPDRHKPGAHGRDLWNGQGSECHGRARAAGERHARERLDSASAAR
jgi:hypothetical protein